MPTSEKMFVGNIPTGSKFFGEKLCVGIYWENAWGARDLDLSASAITGEKIGWNAGYSTGLLTYSGDITNAPSGAVEYLHCKSGTNQPWLVHNNVYSGSDTSGYKIIVGAGDSVDKKFLMDPNKVTMEVRTEAVQKQMILGMFLPESNDTQSFVLLNFGAGHARVGGRNTLGVQALYEQYKSVFDFGLLLQTLGAEVVTEIDPEDEVLDFSVDKLTKDSFTKLFK